MVKTEDRMNREELHDKLDVLEELSMAYEIGVIPFGTGDYLTEFYDFYRVRNRDSEFIVSDEDMCGTMVTLFGEPRGSLVAEKTEAIFGLPSRVTCFDGDFGDLREELGGRRGLSPFFFVFDIMFCEYEDFTLCFIFGTNN